MSGAAALKLGRGLAAANSALIGAKNVDYDALGESSFPALSKPTGLQQEELLDDEPPPPSSDVEC